MNGCMYVCYLLLPQVTLKFIRFDTCYYMIFAYYDNIRRSALVRALFLVMYRNSLDTLRIPDKYQIVG